MASFRQAIAWWCLVPRLMTPEQLIRAAAELGCDGLDLVDPAWWPAVRDAGLTISAVAGHQSIVAGLNRHEHHPRIERELLDAIRQAERWRIPNLICFSGSRAGLSDEAGAAAMVAGLRRVAPAAEAAGVALVVELLNSRVDHPDYQADRTDWAAAVVAAVDSPAVGLLYDIYHMQVMEGDLIRTIGRHQRHIRHYHTAGNPGRANLDDAQEIAYPAVMRAIAATGFTGFVAHEFIPRGDPLTALRQALTQCEVP